MCEYVNGDKYNGTWIDGKRDGDGTCEFRAGGYYEGMWANNHRDGNGFCKFPNGDEYSVSVRNSCFSPHSVYGIAFPVTCRGRGCATNAAVKACASTQMEPCIKAPG